MVRDYGSFVSVLGDRLLLVFLEKIACFPFQTAQYTARLQYSVAANGKGGNLMVGSTTVDHRGPNLPVSDVGLESIGTVTRDRSLEQGTAVP